MTFFIIWFISVLLSFLIQREIVKRFPDELSKEVPTGILLFGLLPILGLVMTLIILVVCIGRKFQGLDVLDKVYFIKRKDEK